MAGLWPLCADRCVQQCHITAAVYALHNQSMDIPSAIQHTMCDTFIIPSCLQYFPALLLYAANNFKYQTAKTFFVGAIMHFRSVLGVREGDGGQLPPCFHLHRRVMYSLLAQRRCAGCGEITNFKYQHLRKHDQSACRI